MTMTPAQISARNAATSQHVAVPRTCSGHEDQLVRWGGPGGEWEDTTAVFRPSVLSLYPDVPPHPKAVAYGVGYGTLTAFLDKRGLNSYAAKVAADPEYTGFPSGRYASFESGVWVEAKTK